MIKEVRRNIQIQNKILSSFGTKALKHYDEAKDIDVKVKISKSKFFNPLIDYNTDIPNCPLKIINKRKFYSNKIY